MLNFLDTFSMGVTFPRDPKDNTCTKSRSKHFGGWDNIYMKQNA